MMQRFILQDIKNNTLSANHAMPLKDSTSDGASSFEMGRKIYTNMNMAAPVHQSTIHVSPPTTMRQPNNNFYPTTVTSLAQKKWLGGNNRDASQIIANRRNEGIGKASINLNNTKMAFCNNNNNSNMINSHLRRVRGGGYVVPPKVRASPHHTSGISATT